MQVNLEQILAHANEKLSLLASDADGNDQVELFKKFLKVETERLRMRHRFGLGGIEIARGRTYLVDVVVRRACQLASMDIDHSDSVLATCSVVALGGYGRRDLAPYSDMDIMFLHAGRRSRSVGLFVERVLYLLWDIGLTVGHSVRSIAECVSMAASDLHSRTALCDARAIAGSSYIFRRAAKELVSRIYENKKESAAFLRSIRSELETRYSKFGGSIGVQEPNLKESAGGLRDLHTVLWVGHAKFGCANLDALRAEDHISGQEYSSARRAYEFIMRARNEAHFLTGRKTDLLTLDLQPAVATGLGYKAGRGLLNSELFMRDYYQRARDLHQFSHNFLKRSMGLPDPNLARMSRVKEAAKEAIGGFEVRQGGVFLTIRKKAKPAGNGAAAFETRNGELCFGSGSDDLPSDPLRMMEAFGIAQREGVGLSDALSQASGELLHMVGQGFRSSAKTTELLMQMLACKGRVGFVLRMMHDRGFLGRLIPEFGKITFLVQHDFYHRYTIDEHILKSIEALDELAEPPSPMQARLARVMDEVAAPAALYLSVLLHDIGKGHGAGHVERGARVAERVCARMGLPGKLSDTVVFLVRNHLLMSHLAQRRDLSEDKLVQEFASKVGTLERLDMLLLLTYADMAGVGPGVWNDWKASLLWELFSRARRLLGKDELDEPEPGDIEAVKEKVIPELLPQWPASEIERHLAMLPARYVRSSDPSQIARHFRLVQSLGEASLVGDWRTLDDLQCTELTICSRDSAGLFARIAGALTARGVNILSADLYTREDGIVIDMFKICLVKTGHPVRPEQWSKIEQDIIASIEGRYDVEAAVEKWRTKNMARRKASRHPRGNLAVHFDQDSSDGSTVLEVRKRDEPGLAFMIANRLALLGLSINFARIATEKGRALDIFYVTDAAGNKLRAAAMATVEEAIAEALKG
ncbi:MAG TPA: [protein-PII] uridylyltransferase [Blastocatellia bacterium]